jgi:glutamyl-tRNA reductase
VIAVRPVAGTLSPAAGPYGFLVAVGISHRTATVALRERAALTESAARALLGDLRSMPAVSAAAVLSTCNRTGLHAIAAAPDAVESLRRALAAIGRLTPEAVGGRAVGLDALAAEVGEADLVVACTGAPEPVLRRPVAARAVRSRGGRPLVCIDLAMPRDIEPGVARLPGVVLFDVDDLRGIADANRWGRALAARRGEAIVLAELARCVDRGRRRSLASAA